MDKKMQNEVETGVIWWFPKIFLLGFPIPIGHNNGESNGKENCKQNGNWDSIAVCWASYPLG